MIKNVIFVVSILLLILLLGFYMVQSKHGNIILLNGISSSGKSAILNEFIKSHSDYRVLKIDDWFPEKIKAKAKELGWKEDSGVDQWLFLYDYMAEKTGQYLFATELREQLFTDSTDFYQKAKDISLKGGNVIIDTVLEYEKEYVEFFTFFKDFPTKKILVYCSLDLLLKRVENRNKTGAPGEMRFAFQSFEQFPAMYKIQENNDEPVVDKVKSLIIKKALETSIEELINNKIPEPYIVKLEEFKKRFIEQFKLNQCEQIILVAKHHYDLIINSGINSPQELANKITNSLQ